MTATIIPKYQNVTGELASHPSPPEGWPTHAPLLVAKDIAQGMFRCREQRCLVGWFYATFKCGLEQAPPPLTDAILNGRGAMSFNDHNEPEVVAFAWNKYIESIGYVIPRKEATTQI